MKEEDDDDEEISIHSGTEVWKTYAEHWTKFCWAHGFPYYQITRVGDTYYMWELDLENPDSFEYHIYKKSKDFDVLWKEGLKIRHPLDIDKYVYRHGLRIPIEEFTGDPNEDEDDDLTRAPEKE